MYGMYFFILFGNCRPNVEKFIDLSKIDLADLDQLIHRSVEIKNEIVSQDLTERDWINELSSHTSHLVDIEIEYNENQEGANDQNDGSPT